ncbi:MAG: hypothetical protein RBU29_06245 [bacterium]|nr:hypothetical protein [bacterium]
MGDKSCPHTTTLVFLVVTILLLQSPFPNAKILTIPGDAPSIEEAIERAESGDIIQVNQANVPFCKDAPCVNFDSETGCFMGNPVIIQNKDLTFIAPTRVELGMVWGPAINQLNSYSMLQINNSNVTFCNFYLPETLRTHVFWGSVIQVNSGTLTLQSCYWKCLIECSGNLIVDQCTIVTF